MVMALFRRTREAHYADVPELRAASGIIDRDKKIALDLIALMLPDKMWGRSDKKFFEQEVVPEWIKNGILINNREDNGRALIDVSHVLRAVIDDEPSQHRIRHVRHVGGLFEDISKKLNPTVESKHALTSIQAETIRLAFDGSRMRVSGDERPITTFRRVSSMIDRVHDGRGDMMNALCLAQATSIEAAGRVAVDFQQDPETLREMTYHLDDLANILTHSKMKLAEHPRELSAIANTLKTSREEAFVGGERASRLFWGVLGHMHGHGSQLIKPDNLDDTMQIILRNSDDLVKAGRLTTPERASLFAQAVANTIHLLDVSDHGQLETVCSRITSIHKQHKLSLEHVAKTRSRDDILKVLQMN